MSYASDVDILSYLKEFNGYLDEVIQILSEPISSDVDKAFVHFKKVLEYNVAHGKKLRGLLVVASFDVFVTESNTFKCRRRLANLVGWAIELLQASFLVLDDIIDGSSSRRGKPCWYLAEETKELGMMAVNDGLHLYMAVFRLLRKIFGSDSELAILFMKLQELFEETAYRTCIGQTLDILTSLSGENCSDTSHWSEKYTQQNLSTIYQWKTAYYSFYLPVACGMILADVTSTDLFDKAKIILIQVGKLFQTQDDYLDVFGNYSQIGKNGTDIEDRKCAWPVVKALEISTDDQKKKIIANYGIKDPVCVSVVRDLFIELKLKDIYENLELTIKKELDDTITRYCSPSKQPDAHRLPEGFFRAIVAIIFKRSS